MDNQIQTNEENENQLTEREKFQMEYQICQQNFQLAQNGIDMINNAISVYRESQQIKRDIVRIEAESTVRLANIAAKYAFCHNVLVETYTERSTALQKHYEVLESAINKGDRELIIASLHGISSIVVENPIDNFTQLINAWNDQSKPLELDF